MKRNLIRTLICVCAISGMTGFASAQRASPAAKATGVIDGANITIKYSSPGVKDRKIYGELVPYDQVWRAGANEATIFETDKDIKIEGKKIPAGKYSLYAIPSANDWIIIFNSATGQWGINNDGSTTEDPAKDVIRVTVTPKKTTTLTERLVYNFNKDAVVLSWEYLDVPISVK